MPRERAELIGRAGRRSDHEISKRARPQLSGWWGRELRGEAFKYTRTFVAGAFGEIET